MIVPKAVRAIERRGLATWKMTWIAIPYKTVVGERAFAECSELKSFEAPGLKVLETATFERCGSLKGVEVPSLVSIGADAFAGCKSLENFRSPPAVVFIGKQQL